MPKYSILKPYEIRSNKSVEAAKFIVAKKNIPNIKAQVSICLDVSGSARNLFSSGQIQEVFQRILPIGITFDLNQQIDVYTFADGKSISHISPTASAQNYDGYVQKNILDNPSVPKWGCTDYAPVLHQNIEDFGFYKKSLFGGAKLTDKAESGEPVIIYFLTDGANADKGATRKLFKQCVDAKTEVYVLFIGVGPASSFSFIEECGEEFPNVGFWNVSDLSALQKEDVYEQLIPDELVQWLKAK